MPPSILPDQEIIYIYTSNNSQICPAQWPGEGTKTGQASLKTAVAKNGALYKYIYIWLNI